MSKIIKWSIAVLMAYIFFLIYTLPSAHVLSRIDLYSGINITGVSGTVWQGNASAMSVNGLVVDDIDWELSFFPLLLGKISLDLDAGNSRDPDDISFKGPVTLNMFNLNQLSAGKFNLFLPSALVISQMPLPLPVDAGGRFRVQIESLDYDQGCQVLQGQGQWLKANLIGMGDPLELGNFDADLSCIDGDTRIQVKEPNLFGLSADARIPMDFAFSVTGRFKPDPSLPKQVHDAAKFFEGPDSNGYYTIEF
jgi:general secretion pathway protein N